MTLNHLYNIADQNGIEVYHFPLPNIKSMSVPDFIGIDADTVETTAEEKTMLAHEIGHCMKGAFYTGTSKLELRSKKEYIANKWAVHTLIPFDELIEALTSGITERYDLADYFGVTEELVNKAYAFYEERFKKHSSEM